MATIIPLNREPERTQDSNSYADAVQERSAAEVVLFPGVRYERWPETQAAPKMGTTPGVSATVRNTTATRDWLEI